jgi:hypothetical protein
VVVATTLANLSNPYCIFTDVSNIITLIIFDCGIPLSSQMLSFSGEVIDRRANLKWTTTDETEPLFYDIEKSFDGTNFTTIATVNSYSDYSEQNDYTYIDPMPLSGKAFYRIRMRNAPGNSKYSRIIQLSFTTETFSFVSVINPFGQQLVFEVASETDGKVMAELIDVWGKTIRKSSFNVTAGINRLFLDNTDDIATGIYILRVYTGNAAIQRRVLKQN